MISRQDFEYAMESTRVIVEPGHLIETFGTTTFRFVLVTELLDEAHKVKVRNGKIEAERPRIVAPQHFRKLLLEGFGEDARNFADWLESRAEFFKILRYGFSLRKTDISESILGKNIDEALQQLAAQVTKEGGTALISGIDEAWEVSLLKFTSDLIRRSSGENLGEWKRRGLI